MDGADRGALGAVTGSAHRAPGLRRRTVVPHGSHQERGARVGEPKSGASPGTLEAVRVLVVDDEADARDLIAALLEQHGAEVTTAGSVRAALDAARARRRVAG